MSNHRRWILTVAFLSLLCLNHPGSAQASIGGAMDGAFKGAMFGRLVGNKKTARRAAAVGGVLGVAAGAGRDARAREQQAQIAARNAELARARQAEEAHLAAEKERAWSEAAADQQQASLISETQRSLIRLGYEPGPVGMETPEFAAAVTLYQRDAGLLETGDPSQALLKHMIRNGG